MKNLLKNFLIIFVSLFLIASLLSLANISEQEPEQIGVNTLVSQINEEKVSEIAIKGNIISVKLNDEETATQEVKKESGQSFAELISNYGVDPEKLQKINVKVVDDRGFAFWVASLAPYL